MRKSYRIMPPLRYALLLAAALVPALSSARDPDLVRIPVTLGDYRFTPHELTVTAGQPVLLELSNTDNITPHNFTLEDKTGQLDINVDVPAGEKREVALTAAVPGNYTFYCRKKLPFLKSHRARGMEGTLVVTP